MLAQCEHVQQFKKGDNYMNLKEFSKYCANLIYFTHKDKENIINFDEFKEVTLTQEQFNNLNFTAYLLRMQEGADPTFWDEIEFCSHEWVFTNTETAEDVVHHSEEIDILLVDHDNKVFVQLEELETENAYSVNTCQVTTQSEALENVKLSTNIKNIADFYDNNVYDREKIDIHAYFYDNYCDVITDFIIDQYKQRRNSNRKKA